jgi:hypothetical protein
MTRVASATTTRRGGRSKKRTPSRRTAHIEYQPAGLDRTGRRVREAYHAITDQAVKVGFLTRWPGTPSVARPARGPTSPTACSPRW